MVGLNTGDDPEATSVVPHEPVYQSQLAAVPKNPPVTPRVVALPKQIGVVPIADVAGWDKVFTITVVVTHVVVLHVPSALTKYSVVTVGLITGDSPEIA